jgi:hypothetical protein
MVPAPVKLPQVTTVPKGGGTVWAVHVLGPTWGGIDGAGAAFRSLREQLYVGGPQELASTCWTLPITVSVL